MTHEDAAELMRQRLQGDLRAAMKARALLEVAVLRTLIATIDNAGAVAQIPEPGSRYGGSSHVVTGGAAGSAEAPRRRLSSEDVQALLADQFEVRRAAAAELDGLNRGVDAQRARDEAAVVRGYLLGV